MMSGETGAKGGKTGVTARRLLPYLITVIAFAALAILTDVKETVTALISINPRYLALIIVLSLTSNVLFMSIRIKILFDDVGCPISLSDSAMLRLGGMPLRILLPLKLGEGVKVLYLKTNSALGITSGIGVVLFDKATALLGLLTASTLCLVLYGGHSWITLLSLAAFTALFALYFTRLGTALFTRFSTRPGILSKAYELVSTADRVGVKCKTLVYAISLATWSCDFLQFYFCFRAVGIEVNLVHFLSTIPIVLFVGSLPIAVEGLGIREVSLIALMAAAGSDSHVLGAGLLFSFTDSLFLAILGLPFVAPLMKRVVRDQKTDGDH
ncbi:lysylphosphatidylglycerol synthase transmembrane domain-containing protein [Thermodesulfobacteriota bacterium]